MLYNDCEVCENDTVVGVENALLMGMIDVEESSKGEES